MFIPSHLVRATLVDLFGEENLAPLEVSKFPLCFFSKCTGLSRMGIVFPLDDQTDSDSNWSSTVFFFQSRNKSKSCYSRWELIKSQFIQELSTCLSRLSIWIWNVSRLPKLKDAIKLFNSIDGEFFNALTLLGRSLDYQSWVPKDLSLDFCIQKRSKSVNTQQHPIPSIFEKHPIQFSSQIGVYLNRNGCGGVPDSFHFKSRLKFLDRFIYLKTSGSRSMHSQVNSAQCLFLFCLPCGWLVDSEHLRIWQDILLESTYLN